MASFLRILILIMTIGMLSTAALALRWMQIDHGHIRLAIASFIFLIFVQVFVMFYFVGVARLARNLYEIVASGSSLHDVFEVPPLDISPYVQETKKILDECVRSKRQTIPWAVLMLVLGSLAFLTGAAHDTGLAEKATHSGIVLGHFMALLIGFFRQWYYLGKIDVLLKRLKGLYGMSAAQM